MLGHDHRCLASGPASVPPVFGQSERAVFANQRGRYLAKHIKKTPGEIWS